MRVAVQITGGDDLFANMILVAYREGMTPGIEAAAELRAGCQIFQLVGIGPSQTTRVRPDLGLFARSK